MNHKISRKLALMDSKHGKSFGNKQSKGYKLTTTGSADNAIDLPWRNFPNPEFGTKFQREVHPNFCRYPHFRITLCGAVGRKPPRHNQLDSSSPLVTDGHTTTTNTALYSVGYRCAVNNRLRIDALNDRTSCSAKWLDWREADSATATWLSWVFFSTRVHGGAC